MRTNWFAVPIIALSTTLSAQGTRRHIDSLIPPFTHFVADAAHLLSPNVADRLNQRAREIQTRDGADVVVLTLPDIGSNAPNEVAMEVGRVWKVGGTGDAGDAHRNLGAVILLVPRTSTHKGQCFVAPGLGLEGTLTDSRAGSICRSATDQFRAGDYSIGLTTVFDGVEASIDAAVKGVAPPAIKASGSSSSSLPLPLRIFQVLFFLLFFCGIIFIINVARRMPGSGRGIAWGGIDTSSGGSTSFSDSSDSSSSSDSTGGGGGFDGGGGGSDF